MLLLVPVDLHDTRAASNNAFTVEWNRAFPFFLVVSSFSYNACFLARHSYFFESWTTSAGQDDWFVGPLSSTLLHTVIDPIVLPHFEGVNSWQASDRLLINHLERNRNYKSCSFLYLATKRSESLGTLGKHYKVLGGKQESPFRLWVWRHSCTFRGTADLTIVWVGNAIHRPSDRRCASLT